MIASSGKKTRNKKIGQLISSKYLSSTISEKLVSGIALDSRKVVPGDMYFSFAVSATDTVRNLDDALARGAVAVVSRKQTATENAADQNECVRVYVADVNAAAAKAADIFFETPSRELSVVGVTGTNGKTSCVDMLGQALRALGKPAATMGTLGVSLLAGKFEHTGFTTMDIVENQRRLSDLTRQNITDVAMEVSSHGIEQGRISGIQFAVKVITNISRDHLDYHGTMRSYADTKLQFMSWGAGHLIANLDDERIHAWVDSQGVRPVISYSVENPKALVTVSEIKYALDGIAARVKSPWGSAEIKTTLIGAFNLSNVLAVLSVLCAQGEPLDRVIGAVNSLHSVPGRMERVNVESQDLVRNVYIDYAHTPDALDKALSALKAHAKEKVVCVFGCGGDRDVGKRPLMAAVAEAHADVIYVTNDNPRNEPPSVIIEHILAGFKSQENVIVLENRKQAIRQAIASSGEKDIVLLAGKGHENYQIIGDKKLSFSDFDIARELMAG